MDIVTKATATVEPIDSKSANGEFDVILSTAALDRDGDELRPGEWKQPLPDHITFDSDHGMSVESCVGSGKPFINDDGQLQVRGTFASTPHAQNVRTLVNEGHIRSVSVSFMSRKEKKGAGVERELLNGAFVAVPANPEAVVLASKGAGGGHKHDEPYGNVHYADPGFRGPKRYPVNDPEHVRAAWDYFHHANDRDKYTAAEQHHIEDEIRTAARKFGIKLEGDSKKGLEMKDAPHATGDATGQHGRYEGALEAPDRQGTYPSPDAPDGADGASDAHDGDPRGAVNALLAAVEQLHSIARQLAANPRVSGVQAHAGLTDGAPSYGKGLKGALPIGSSDAEDKLHGVQAVLRNVATHLRDGKSPQEIAAKLGNGNAPEDADWDDESYYPHLDLIHRAAQALGGQVTSNNPNWAEDGEVWGANSPHIGPVGPKSLSAKSADAADPTALMWAAELTASTDEADIALARAKALEISLTAIA